jgi:hypothetical protein
VGRPPLEPPAEEWRTTWVSGISIDLLLPAPELNKLGPYIGWIMALPGVSSSCPLPADGIVDFIVNREHYAITGDGRRLLPPREKVVGYVKSTGAIVVHQVREDLSAANPSSVDPWRPLPPRPTGQYSLKEYTHWADSVVRQLRARECSREEAWNQAETYYRETDQRKSGDAADRACKQVKRSMARIWPEP